MTTHDKSPHQSINQPFTRRTLSFKENAMSLSRDSDNHRLVAHLPLRPWLYTLGLAWMSLAAFLGDPLAGTPVMLAWIICHTCRHPQATGSAVVRVARLVWKVAVYCTEQRRLPWSLSTVLALVVLVQVLRPALGPTPTYASTPPVQIVTRLVRVVVRDTWKAPRTRLAQDRVARPAVSSNFSAYILHSPSISSGTIQRALEAMGSPMASATATDSHGVTKNLAQYLYDAGRVTGVDPAVMLAIFYNESHGGRDGMARLTHSVGNQRPSGGFTPVIGGSDGTYQYFNTWADGVDAQCALLRRYATGQGFPHAMPRWIDAVYRYAPSSDLNDPSGYLSVVLGKIYEWEVK